MSVSGPSRAEALSALCCAVEFGVNQVCSFPGSDTGFALKPKRRAFLSSGDTTALATLAPRWCPSPARDLAAPAALGVARRAWGRVRGPARAFPLTSPASSTRPLARPRENVHTWREFLRKLI